MSHLCQSPNQLGCALDFAGIICLLLQLSVIGWIPAAIWSVYALSQYKTDKKIEDALGGD